MKKNSNKRSTLPHTRLNIDEPELRDPNINHFLEDTPNLHGEGFQPRTMESRSNDRGFDPITRDCSGDVRVTGNSGREEGCGYH